MPNLRTIVEMVVLIGGKCAHSECTTNQQIVQNIFPAQERPNLIVIWKVIRHSKSNLPGNSDCLVRAKAWILRKSRPVNLRTGQLISTLTGKGLQNSACYQKLTASIQSLVVRLTFEKNIIHSQITSVKRATSKYAEEKRQEKLCSSYPSDVDVRTLSMWRGKKYPIALGL